MLKKRERTVMGRNGLVAALCLCAMLAINGCASFTPGANFAAISAASKTIRVNQQIQFTSEVLSLKSPLAFSVNGIPGGNSEVGTISDTGMYTAPAIVPAPNTVTITDTSVQYPSTNPGTATIAVLNPIPAISNLTPSAFSEGTTTVTVSGSQFVYGAQILWNGAAVSTTFVSATELVAAIPAPDPGSYSLTVMNPDPGSASSNAVPVLVSPGKVVLKLYTGQGPDVRVSNPLNIGLSVSGTNNTGVTLQVNGVTGGNAQVGTAAVNQDGSITYAAPAVVPTPSNVVVLKVISVDDPTVSITQNISVMNPIPILTSATPMTFSVGSSTVVVQGARFISGAQVLVNGAAAPTTFNSGTQLTATINPSEPGNLDLQVLNPAPGPATSADVIALVSGNPPTPQVSPEDASRFLQEATFGATDGDIHHLSLIGYQAWLNEQFNTQPTPQEPAVENALILNNPACSASDLQCNTALFEQNDQDEIYVNNAFWQQSIAGSDQLRQRVKYALSQMFVISGTTPAVQNMPRAEATYYDMLGADAFGNFRQLLQDVTLSPAMGRFLSMQGNDKGNSTTDPDENYAREVMQLFTTGLFQLKDDGSQVLDANGKPIPTYSNNDVIGLAKVFTGFSWNTSTGNWSNCCLSAGPGTGSDIVPMQSYASHHSTAQKDFLGVTIPAQVTPDPDGDLKIALDTLFNHPNLPAFFSRQMIQHLVTSNPSPAYISRVAAVFKDNGQGVRGDLQAVITAILLDQEARDSSSDIGNPQFGKVRESLIRYTEWARAFSAQSRTGSYYLNSTEDPIWGLGEMTLRSPTVFNWFSPGYVPPATSIEQAGMVAPEMQMTNVSSVVGYLNYMEDSIGSGATSGSDVFSSYATEIGLAATPNLLLDRINLLLMAGEMNSTLYNQILSAVSSIAIPSGDQTATNAALANRVKAAIYLTMASPDYSGQY